jgi:hypothetical protein
VTVALVALAAAVAAVAAVALVLCKKKGERSECPHPGVSRQMMGLTPSKAGFCVIVFF